MTAVINDVCDRIETIWEALTPPDNTEVGYLRVDTKTIPEGTSGHRKFYFETERVGVTGEAGTSMTETMWGLVAWLRLAQEGRTNRTFWEAINNEGNLLCRTVEIEPFSSVSGMIGFNSFGFRNVEIADGGDALIPIRFEIHTQETD